MPGLTIGTASARPGQIVNGWFEGVPLPTGGVDCFPVIIAQGAEPDGPVLWLTSGVHGDEHTGLIVIQELITPELVSAMRGTLIAVPVLSPAGLRTRQRTAYYHGGDPNRAFPSFDHSRDQTRQAEGSQRPISGLEEAYRRLFDAIAASQASALLDLHNAAIGSIPFVFRDPVFYHRRQGRLRADALKLDTQLSGMLDALGFTIVNEFVSEAYIEHNLHRSVSGSLLNRLGIPAATVELGSWMHVDPYVVPACQTAIRNVMRHLGMLDSPPESLAGIPIIRPGYSVRRIVHPYAPQAGIVHHLVRPGETFVKDQALARLTDIFGQPIGSDNGLLRSPDDGFVLAWHHGVLRYQGDPIMVLAVRDESDMVVPYPD